MAYPSSLSLLFVLPVLGVGIEIEKTMAGQIEQNDLVLSLFFRSVCHGDILWKSVRGFLLLRFIALENITPDEKHLSMKNLRE